MESAVERRPSHSPPRPAPPTALDAGPRPPYDRDVTRAAAGRERRREGRL